MRAGTSRSIRHLTPQSCMGVSFFRPVFGQPRAYRRLWRNSQGDDELSDKLIGLYIYMGDLDSAIYIAEARLEKDPNHPASFMEG